MLPTPQSEHLSCKKVIDVSIQCFCSKKLNIHQRRYATIEKEALALLTVVRHFSVYFGSQPVKVYTDHSPLTFLDRIANQNEKLLRWRLELQQYKLEIMHRSGNKICSQIY